MSKSCIKAHAPHLAKRFDELMATGKYSEKEAGRKAAMEDFAKLDKELNTFKESIGIKLTKEQKAGYKEPDNSAKVKEITDDYADKIKAVEQSLKETPKAETKVDGGNIVGGEDARKSMSKEIDSQVSAKENELIEKQKQDIDKAKNDLEAINSGDKSTIDEYVKKSGYKLVTKEVIANNPKSELLKKSEGKYYTSNGASIQVKTAEQIAIEGATKKANSKAKGSNAGVNQYVDAYNAITKFSEGKITAEEAKNIIEKAGLKIPKAVEQSLKEQPKADAPLVGNEDVSKVPETIVPENIDTESKTEEPSIKAKGKELADKIRNLRPKKDGDLRATIFALPIAIYDTAIVTIANAIEAGANLADAINEGVKYINSQVKDWQDKDGKFSQHINDAADGKKPRITAQTTDEDIANPKEETGKKKESNDKRANTNELNKLAVDIPGASSVKKYLSGATIKKYTDYDPTNPQEYSSTELEIAFVQGENIIEKAKELFGGKYVSELLDYVERANITNAAKSLIYVSLANDLYKQKKAFPDKFEEITKLEFMVNREAQAFAHDISVALGLRRLQNLQLYGTDTSNIADSILTPTEQEQKAKLEDAVQVDDGDVNKEFEQEQNTEENVTEQTEQADTAKAVEEDKKEKKAKKDTRKKSPKSQWKAVSMTAEEIKLKMDEIKNKINKLDC